MTVTDRAVRAHPRRAYHVVDHFEQELCRYTGAPYAVTTNSCTNALLLALSYERPAVGLGLNRIVRLPRRTYVGVLQSALNAGFSVEWRDEPDLWQQRGYYSLAPTNIWDFARALSRNLYADLLGGIVCLSFHSAKQLPLGRGGAILTDDFAAYEWFRAARMDGRAPGTPGRPIFPAWHCPMPPDVAARGLDVLSRWSDAGFEPSRLPQTDYPDLSQWWPR